MTSIRKSNLRGKKGWLQQDSSRQESKLRGSRINEDTTLPPLPKSTPEFLSRQSRNRAYFSSKNSYNVGFNTWSSAKAKTETVDRKNRENRNHKAIPVMPDGSKLPIWLMGWNSFHRQTSVVTFLLVSATLIVYGCTVYSQHLWSRSYKKLQDLQRDERQLTKHDETLKNKMAQEAEKPRSGLVSPTPANTIFLEETAPLNSRKVDRESLQTQPLPSNAVGY